MLLFVWLSAIIPIASPCVDLLFVVDPQDELAIGRSVKIANELGHRVLFLSVITKKSTRLLSITAKNKADLIELLHNVQGTYTELLGAVSKKLARRKIERPLIVLLFTEKNVPQKLTDSWKEMKNSTLHIFRVGAAKNKPVQSGEIQKSTIGMVMHTTTVRPIPSGCVVDIIFLVDFSKGTGEKSQSYFDLAATTVGVLPIGPGAVRVAMIGYSGPGRATALFHLDKHGSKDDLIEELFRMEQHGGTTRTAEAIRFANKEFGNSRHGARKGARKVIVVFTDGYSQDDPTSAAEKARRDGVQLVTVSVSDRFSPDREILQKITSNNDLVLISPSGHLIRDKVLGPGCNL